MEQRTQKSKISEPISETKLTQVLDKIDNLNQQVKEAQADLKDYYNFLKERGINIAVLKQVAGVWASSEKETFEKYWSKFVLAYEQSPVTQDEQCPVMQEELDDAVEDESDDEENDIERPCYAPSVYV